MSLHLKQNAEMLQHGLRPSGIVLSSHTEQKTVGSLWRKARNSGLCTTCSCCSSGP